MRADCTWMGRCLVDGVDVTNRCYAADDEEGWADCHVVNEEGEVLLISGGGVQNERLYGTVELVPAPGTSEHVLDA